MKNNGKRNYLFIGVQSENCDINTINIKIIKRSTVLLIYTQITNHMVLKPSS